LGPLSFYGNFKWIKGAPFAAMRTYSLLIVTTPFFQCIIANTDRIKQIS
jgi:hypothetical protein